MITLRCFSYLPEGEGYSGVCISRVTYDDGGGRGSRPTGPGIRPTPVIPPASSFSSSHPLVHVLLSQTSLL